MKIQELDEIMLQLCKEHALKLMDSVKGKKIRWVSARQNRFDFTNGKYDVAIYVAIAPKKKGSFIA